MAKNRTIHESSTTATMPEPAATIEMALEAAEADRLTKTQDEENRKVADWRLYVRALRGQSDSSVEELQSLLDRLGVNAAQVAEDREAVRRVLNLRPQWDARERLQSEAIETCNRVRIETDNLRRQIDELERQARRATSENTSARDAGMTLVQLQRERPHLFSPPSAPNEPAPLLG